MIHLRPSSALVEGMFSTARVREKRGEHVAIFSPSSFDELDHLSVRVQHSASTFFLTGGSERKMDEEYPGIQPVSMSE